MKTFKISALALAVALTACGGGGSSSGGSSNPPSSSGDTETGIFTDSAVAGINYQTTPGNKSGKTNALGEYDYVEGDTVTFSIGDTVLPEVTATGRVTPADMSDNADVVTNILQLLQTLDDDGNPDNGIAIPDSAHTTLTSVSLDVTGASGDFDAQAEEAIGEPLVSEEDANAHFEASQQADLLGSWMIDEGSNKRNVLTFMESGDYILTHSYANEDQGAATAEWGSYSWDTGSGDITLTLQAESDGEGGLTFSGDETPKTASLSLGNGELYFDLGEGDVFTATAIQNNGLAGAWYLQEEEGFNVLTILDGSHYTVAHNGNSEVYEGDNLMAVSSEWGTYSLSGSQFSVTSVQAETDGPGGLYDETGNNGITATATLGTDTLTFDIEGEGPFTFTRIGN